MTKTPEHPKPAWINFIAAIALIFGAMTLFSGGSVLFIDGQARADAGNYVSFIVWFNFIAGFFYIAAGMGIICWQKWGLTLSRTILVATVIAFIGLAGHIATGGSYEMRTVIAMALRSFVWLAISFAVGAAWNKSMQDHSSP